MSQKQITKELLEIIPDKIREKLDVCEGDYIGFEEKECGFLVVLKKKEEELVMRAEEKIKKIQKDIVNSVGLTTEEALAAERVGLIGKGQAYWWTEEWQKDEREIEREKIAGKKGKAFKTAKDAIDYFHSREM